MIMVAVFITEILVGFYFNKNLIASHEQPVYVVAELVE